MILPRSPWRAGLGEDDVQPDQVLALLRQYPAELMRAYPIGLRVGNVRNNDAELLSEIAA